MKSLMPLPHYPLLNPKKHKKKQTKKAHEKLGMMTDWEWPPSEEEFMVLLKEDVWHLFSAIAHDEKSNSVKAHRLELIKTPAKDDTGKIKTYWIYRVEKKVEHFEEKHIKSFGLIGKTYKM